MSKRTPQPMPVPRSKQRAVVTNASVPGFGLTRDGTSARLACTRCPDVINLDDDEESIGEARAAHDKLHGGT